MCDVDYDETADVWHESTPVARKTHRCDECGRTIPAGARYVNIGSLYEGRWTRYRAHPECVALTKHIAFAVCDQEHWYPGNQRLQERVAEHAREAPELIRGWRWIRHLYPEAP